jgi:hypothetical protein
LTKKFGQNKCFSLYVENRKFREILSKFHGEVKEEEFRRIPTSAAPLDQGRGGHQQAVRLTE